MAQRYAPFHTWNLRVEIIDRAIGIGDVEIVGHVRTVIERHDIARSHLVGQVVQLHVVDHDRMFRGGDGQRRDERENRNAGGLQERHIVSLRFPAKAGVALARRAAAPATFSDRQ